MEKTHMPKLVSHQFDPVYDEHSRILILGTMPSVKSREHQFYYMHPQNRFWKVLSSLLEWEFPATTEQKKQMLLCNHIALWDVLASCEIRGSADSSIKSPVVNDFEPLFARTQIQEVYTNGRKADELYRKYSFPRTGRAAIYLPSTSPANASFSLDRLLASWQVLLERIR